MEGAIFHMANLQQASLEYVSFTVEQIFECQNIEGVKFLSKEFLLKVKQINPDLMRWWIKAWPRKLTKQIHGQTTKAGQAAGLNHR